MLDDRLHRNYCVDVPRLNKPMKELLLQPADMIEELMYHILWNEFDGELNPDHKYFPLYLSLQQLLEDETRRLEE
mgnify:CR=1 FL=1